MIGHFFKQRTEIEALVASYRDVPWPPKIAPQWDDLPEIAALKDKAGIRRVVNSGAVWVDDPYSVDTAKKLEDMARHNAPKYSATKRRFGAVEVKLSDQRYGPRPAVVRTSIATIWKDLYFIPQSPRLGEGKLWQPANVYGQVNVGHRVLAQLDSYPKDWMKGECVFRSIEPQWFIRMCWGAT